MTKNILITGSTDGIGLATAKQLAAQGHSILLHGRTADKLERAKSDVQDVKGSAIVETYLADLSNLKEVEQLADAVKAKHEALDVLINNAGIFRVSNPVKDDGQDVRFVVNTLAPYLLTRRLLPLLGIEGRVVNLSSAAQAPFNIAALKGEVNVGDDFSAYAQSKLALTMWTEQMAEELGANGPVLVAVNPGSMLGSKMVTEGFGVAGGDIGIGADILSRAALSDEFADASGKYFDNDSQRFAAPHLFAADKGNVEAVVLAIKSIVAV
ncbi:SDR family NAD(P)-dependent oxidoreductase [Enterovibrio paralichthyis]|uniref:SDR family NAD(P)-dependent oxidoreductase n=1 Tax=Enterovibrio paralichthyis TaxID=2853805 RepID=UPI001C481EDE|nr:SDR family NAD(P)-dependent oxidoreductase [Enterovibrio paralichthyis]MBV7296376.1 SDR family NAD(P)-dependent oxidoreductase [Enterovibrio paralichthyis]